MIKKILSITKTSYSRYSILFMFDNVISYLVFTKDVLFAYKMNKKHGGK